MPERKVATAEPEVTISDLPPQRSFSTPAHTVESVDDSPDGHIVPISLRDVPATELSAMSLNDTNAPSITFEDVIRSVHDSFPLIEAAAMQRTIAAGNQLAAWGEFDTKLKAASENGPLGFYETYRHSAGFTRPLYGGGEVFGGYRLGDGSFQPWYKERETDEGGEFKAGMNLPLLRDRTIDARRAALWRATYEQQQADPEVAAAVIFFSQEAGLAYWKWVAAGQKYQLAVEWLKLAESRNDQIRRRVELHDLDPPVLVDNERAIAKRQAKTADVRREFLQAAVKLSLYLRDAAGNPVVPSPDLIPEFPSLRNLPQEQVDQDIAAAIRSRPELRILDLQLRRLQVDFAEAHNMTRPGLNLQMTGSQDVGQPASKKRDKSEFELEAGLYFDAPVQRRKGRGKMTATQAKTNQVRAKRRMTENKITAEVRHSAAGLVQTREAVLQARRAQKLAEEMADIERRKFELGESDLLKVVLREQYAIEAAEEVIAETYKHFAALTDYLSALGTLQPSVSALPADDAAQMP